MAVTAPASAVEHELPLVTYVCDPGDGRTLRDISPRIADWTGHPVARWLEDPGLWMACVHPDDRHRVAAAAGTRLRSGEPLDVGYRLLGPDGAVRHVWEQERVVRDADGVPVAIEGLLLDVTALRAADAAGSAAHAGLRDALARAPMLLMALDADGIFTLFEGRVLARLGLRPGALVGRSVFAAYEDVPVLRDGCRRALAGERMADRLALGDLALDLTLEPVVAPDGAVTGVVGLATERAAGSASGPDRAAALAFADALTGLPNRLALADRLAARLAAEQTRLAVLCLGIDDLDAVNAAFGRAAGDELVRQVAARLRTASDGRFTARVTGGEFIVVLEASDGDLERRAQTLADQAIALMRAPFTIEGADIRATATLGYVIAPAGAADPAALIERAGKALHDARQTAPGQAVRREPRDDRAGDRLALVGRLRQALERDEFLLHFQPVWDLASGRVVSAEALIRWLDPERGIVPPGEFIALMEQAGLIESVGHWTTAAACRQAAAWRAEGIEIPIDLNVSIHQLRATDFADRLLAELDAHRLPPCAVTVELNESAAMIELERAVALGERLEGAGVRLALDDFGAELSSLAALRRMPVQALKLDRTFLDAVPEDARAVRCVAGVLALGRELGVDVIAKGVESAAQADFLRGAGCRFAQGYGLGRPMAAAELSDVLRRLPASGTS